MMTTLTIQSESTSTAEYVICQYVADPFRREPRNIGVVVRYDSEVVSRFVGQTKSGIDARQVRWINDYSAYRQWVRFWSTVTQEQNWKDRLIKSSKRHYQVIDGGKLLGTEGDSPLKVLDYLFAVLVDRVGIDTLIDDEVPSHLHPEFRAEVSSLFRESGLMSNQIHSGLGAIFTDRELFGTTRPHKFAFVQLNGEKRPMEVFDFDRTPRRTLDHHAGWARTAFLDVKQADELVSPFAIVAPPLTSAKQDAYDYATGLLQDVCQIVDIRNPGEKEAFLSDCKRVARLII